MPSGYTLSGIVTDDTVIPQPVAGAVVELGAHGGSRSITNQDGFYSFRVLGDNVYVVIASADGFVPSSRLTPILGDTRVDFRLRRPPQSSIRGFVYEIVDGRRVPLADVWVQEFDLEREDHTDANGNFHISSVFDGPDGLWFGKSGYEVRTVHVTVEGETSGINVQLTRAQ